MKARTKQSRFCQWMAATAILLGLAILMPGGAEAQCPLLNRPRPDFNGDCIADVAVGAPNQTRGTYLRAGTVQVIYGTAAGLAAAGTQVFGAENCRLSQDGAITGTGSGMGFGSVLAWGDYNGDRIDDLALGMPNYNPPYPLGGMPEAGMVYVVFGSRAGLNLNSAQHFVSTNLGNSDGTRQFGGVIPTLNVNQNTFDRFGHALASGDFNGDAVDDLAIGTPGEEGWDGVSQIEDAGDVYVLYGRRAGLSSTSRGGHDGFGRGLDAATAQGWSLNGKNHYWYDLQVPPEANDRFGSALAAGDFNGDGRADLAIGAPGKAGGTGSVSVIYGSLAGLHPLAATPNGVVPSQLWHQDVAVPAAIEGVRAPGEWFGVALAAGDFNGDGRADLAVGVPRATVGGAVQAGEVNVIYGSPTGLNPAFVGLPADQIWSQSSAGILDDGVLGGEMFGYAVAAGDFNADGRADLAIGAPYDSPGNVTSSGAVNIIYGSAAGLTAAGNQYWHQDSAGIQDANTPHQNFGRFLAAGNFNFNPNAPVYAADLAVGTPSEVVGGMVGAGAVNVLYGTAGAGLSAVGNQFMHQNNSGEVAQVDDGFGSL